MNTNIKQWVNICVQNKGDTKSKDGISVAYSERKKGGLLCVRKAVSSSN